MGFKDNFNRFFAMDDDYDMDEAQTEQPKNVQEKPELQPNVSSSFQHQSTPKQPERKPNIVALNKIQKRAEIKVVEPRVYAEVQGIADLLLEGLIVIINFKNSDKNQAQKMIDFLMGSVYAIKGDMQRIGEMIFVCTPPNVILDGTEIISQTRSTKF